MRFLACVVTVALLAACGGNDAEVDKLQRQVDDLTRELATLRAELERKANAAAPLPAEAPLEVGDAPTPECRRYLVTLHAYLGCDKVPSKLRDVFTQAATVMRASWRDSTSPEARQTQTEQCRVASAALRDGARTLHCTPALEEHAP